MLNRSFISAWKNTSAIRQVSSIMHSSDMLEYEVMKRQLCAMFHTGLEDITTGSMSRPVHRRKLILHFDVNKTIVPVDSATGETVEAALNVFLSGMAWGKDKEGKWQPKESLSHKPHEVDDVSFYKFEEKRLLKEVTMDRSKLRYHLTSFTDRPQGLNFKPYLNKLLDRLKWKSPYEEGKHKCMTVPGTKSCRFHFILPAFYNLLRQLVADGRDFAVVFRTYGSDAKSVLHSINQAIKHEMHFCSNLEELSENVSSDVYTVKRQFGDAGSELFSVELDETDNEKRSDNETQAAPVFTNQDMYDWFTNMTGVNAIRDNVEDWYTHNFDPNKGKPLWVDHLDENSHHVFFDDNIRPGNIDSIVNLRLKDGKTDPNNDFRSVSRDEEKLFEYSNMVPVNLPEAILDENYFIDKLKLCEEKYSHRLSC